MSESTKVNIRPNVSVLSVLKFLEYETWYALAEFVDNSIASYLAKEKELKSVHGDNFQLVVRIEINDELDKIVIRDNAAGIDSNNYLRAFRAAEIPSDTTGLSEFGMGMKSASCWFSDYWIVRTTALHEKVERTIVFDMNKIVEDRIEELNIKEEPAEASDHYTVIELNKVHRMPRRKGLGKVRSHLSSIYREFIRNKTLRLIVEGEELKFQEPKVLEAKFQEKPYHGVGEIITWRKEIDFKVDDNHSVRGFVAIRETGSTSEAGFALFRRGRVIKGSFDNGFRPESIFGNPNSYRYQRVFGELHLEGFDVSFTKKDIQWDNLDLFLQKLREDITTKEFPLLTQAENYRARASEKEYRAAQKVLDETVSDLEKKGASLVTDIINATPTIDQVPQLELRQIEKTLHRDFVLRFNGINWHVSIELSFDTSLTELIEVGDSFISENHSVNADRQIGIRLSLTHPFMVEHVGADNAKIEPILRLAAALGLAEAIAKSSRIVGDVRRNFNEIISCISKEDQ